MRRRKGIDERTSERTTNPLEKQPIKAIIDVTQIIILIIFITGIIMLIITITQNNSTIKIPSNQTINQRCEAIGMKEAGYGQNFEEKKTYILCKSEYKENQTIIQEPDCMTTCNYMFRRIGTTTGTGIQIEGKEWFRYPEDCKKYCEPK